MTQARTTSAVRQLPDEWLECRREAHHQFQVVDDYHVVEDGPRGKPALIGLTLVCNRCDTIAHDAFKIQRVTPQFEYLVRVGSRRYEWPEGYRIPADPGGPVTVRERIKAEIWRRARERMAARMGG
jgi:hypothetical protein